MLRRAARGARRGAVFVLGVALSLAGVALLFLPGPGLLVLAAGLALLATEFRWARSLVDRVRDRIAETTGRSGRHAERKS